MEILKIDEEKNTAIIRKGINITTTKITPEIRAQINKENKTPTNNKTSKSKATIKGKTKKTSKKNTTTETEEKPQPKK